MNDYDIIVVGAGHAGVEANLAASRLGLKVALYNLSRYNCTYELQPLYWWSWKKPFSI